MCVHSKKGKEQQHTLGRVRSYLRTGKLLRTRSQLGLATRFFVDLDNVDSGGGGVLIFAHSHSI